MPRSKQHLPTTILSVSLPPLTHAFLRRNRGAAVKLHINGRSASGVLGFDEGGRPLIASLCFIQDGLECPLFSHMLTDHEIRTLRRVAPRRLTSAIALTRTDGVLHSDYHFQLRQAVAKEAC